MKPDRVPKKITEMYAFVVVEADGGEGVPAFAAPNGLMMPLMGADLERIDDLTPVAQGIANATGRPMKILKFTGMEQIGHVTPKPVEPRG